LNFRSYEFSVDLNRVRMKKETLHSIALLMQKVADHKLSGIDSQDLSHR
jgi:hypothetical protein